MLRVIASTLEVSCISLGLMRWDAGHSTENNADFIGILLFLRSNTAYDGCLFNKNTLKLTIALYPCSISELSSLVPPAICL